MALSDLFARSEGWRPADCPMCGSDEHEVAFSDRNRRERLEIAGTYARCRPCGTLFLDPAPSDAILADAYAQAFVDPVAPSDEPVAAKAPLVARSWVLELLRVRPHEWPSGDGRGRRLLDFGCNGGDKVAPFLARNWSVFGVDLNRPAIDRARARYPGATFFAGSVDEVPAELRFDVIRMDNVLEHLADPIGVLRSLRKRLAPGGSLYVYVPNARSLSISLLKGGSISSWIPFHLFIPSVQGLSRALERAEFTGYKVRHYSPPSWGPLSIAQQLGRSPSDARLPMAGARALGLGLSAASMVAGMIGRGEEIVVEATR